jgi:uncharacterized protein (DUF1778 family)
MPKNCFLQIRVTLSQKKMIEQFSSAFGYKNISDFVRARALDSGLTDFKLNEILKILKDDKIQKEGK